MSNQIVKICKNHGVLTPSDCWGHNHENGKIYFQCKKCSLSRHTKRRLKNPEKYKAYGRIERSSETKSLTCKKCSKTLLIHEFSAWMFNSRYPYCRECLLHTSRQYTQKTKNSKLLKTYGITLAEYKAIISKQKNLCAICRKPSTTLTKRGTPKELYIDHCHRTKEVRGLLCNGCNLGIGMFKDSFENLAAAAKYLKKHS